MTAVPNRRETPPLPCPECRARGVTGGARIGNLRSTCRTCNNFSQNVRRLTTKRLKDAHPAEFERLRIRVEADLYPSVIEDWSNR